MTFSILYKTLIFATFADDNSLYSIEDNFKEAKTILKKNFELLQGWFYDMVLKSRKCHYLVINKDIANESAGRFYMQSLDRNSLALNFQSHTKSIS